MFALVFCMVQITFTIAQQPVKLNYTFKAGESYEWTQQAKQTVKQQINGTEQAIESNVNSTLHFKVANITATGARIEIEYKKLNLSSSGFMGNVTMDSEGAQDNPHNKIMKSMTGKKFYFTMSKQGAVENVEGVEALWSDFSTLGMDENTQAIMKQTMETSFGPEAFRGSIETSLLYYPETSVKPGSTWSHETAGTMNFPLKVQSTWKLINHTASKAEIETTGVIITTDKNKEVPIPGGLKSTFDLNGSQSGKGTVNTANGWPNAFTVTSSLKGTMTLLAGGMIPADMEVPMEINSETTYSIVKQ